MVSAVAVLLVQRAVDDRTDEAEETLLRYIGLLEDAAPPVAVPDATIAALLASGRPLIVKRRRL